ncbi:hypothetical protein DMR_18640 [Solidesulfovibrio magneticus RS-1]|uniref:Uncharacterized protein n=1 Tax=Solidesulfovibrio magneticus (strain ATCC 700980 / DSM 13731 / RS-1) TaxID=573370 RepID=C4XQJ0_SOLM1|nr:hypothetical protein DMR_18640 [Solidesulfovibrio magneticus RS-1]
MAWIVIISFSNGTSGTSGTNTVFPNGYGVPPCPMCPTMAGTSVPATRCAGKAKLLNKQNTGDSLNVCPCANGPGVFPLTQFSTAEV